MLSLTSPVETRFHRIPAAAKLAVLCLFTLGLFQLSQPWSLALAFAAVAGMIASGGRIFATAALRMLWPLWPFVVVLVLWHLWQRDIAGGAVVILRLMTAMAAANLVTMTTRLSDMLGVAERLCRPLARIGLPPRAIALAAALVIRFVPVLAERLALIRDAWRARSPRRPGWRILIPATLAALDDADHVAEALRARGGTG